MTRYVIGLHELDWSGAPEVGGKGANLAHLSRVEGIRVPVGFCVTTDAFLEVTHGHRELATLLEKLAGLAAHERHEIHEVSAAIRRVIEGTPIPPMIERAIAERVVGLGENLAFAVRSSATAEDMPTASSAGQHDSYLNIVGARDISVHVRRCWASLFTERAVAYRIQDGIDHRRVQMAVVIQRMVSPRISGIAFTADPLTSNRKVMSIDAVYGLGDALVSGAVNADTYRVRDGAIELVRQLEPNARILADEQVRELERLGRIIERHQGEPQDIEWCLDDTGFLIVQSRPITTLYPVPEQDDAPHVYISVGHQQMMTDVMRPLGLSMWLLTTPASMRVAGGRLFVDAAPLLASPARAAVVATLGHSDPLMKDALSTLVERGFVPPVSTVPEGPPPAVFGPPPVIDNDPSIAAAIVARSQASIETLRREIATQTGAAVFDFILADLVELAKHLRDPQSTALILAAMGAATWINTHAREWLGESNAADTLSLSAPDNATSEMGLALLDVADVIRPWPQVVDYLQRATDATFFEGFSTLDGGPAARDAIAAYLAAYGARCVGEIDITRTRWAESPTTIVPLILAHVRRFEPGESRRKFERGQRDAAAKEREFLDRLARLPDGAQKVEEMRAKISVLRNFIGYREYPKFAMVQRYFEYRKAILREIDRLVAAGALAAVDDAYYLTFAELHEAARAGSVDEELVRDIDERRVDYVHYEKLTPPRVMTSEGEVITGTYERASLPPNALVGLAVSSGVIEGRARVIARIEDATLEDGDILVTTFTDPSWTPMFVSIKGLVTEVGGLMTHGAVIAREYGVPAVVGVEHATRRIVDGQRIRINGTDGYVELL